MDNNRLTFGASANFEGCFEVIRVNTETGICDFLGQSAELTDNRPTIGEYFAGLAESGWIYPEDYAAYSQHFDLNRMRERLEKGRLILNGIRVKPADVYLWTDFEMICPKSCPQSIFIFIRSLKRMSRPAVMDFKLLLAVNSARKAVYPIKAPFGDFNDFRGALDRYIIDFGAEISSIHEEIPRELHSGNLTLELVPCGAKSENLLAAIYETGSVSTELRKEVYDYYGKIDAETGLCGGYYVKECADRSEEPYMGAMLINAEGAARDKALCILKCDFADCSFARDEKTLAVVLTSVRESRLRFALSALCQRLSDTGCDYMVRISETACPISAEELLLSAEKIIPQTPTDFQWSSLETV